MHAFSLDYPPLGLEAANIAYSIAAHQGFSSPFLRVSGPSGPTAWLSPVYPYLLAIPVMIFGAHSFGALLAALILNQAFSGLTCWPLFNIGKQLSGPKLGALAAWLWALFPVAIWGPYVAVWYTSLSAWLIAVLLLATLRVRHSQTVTRILKDVMTDRTRLQSVAEAALAQIKTWSCDLQQTPRVVARTSRAILMQILVSVGSSRAQSRQDVEPVWGTLRLLCRGRQ